MDNSATLGIDLNIKDNAGQTPLHLACRWGYIKIVKVFMENSATSSTDFNTKDNAGRTAFQLALNSDQKFSRNCVRIMRKNADTLKIDLETDSY